MKWKFTLLFLFTAFTKIIAQDITGVWSGTFEEQIYNPMFGKFLTNTYKYEVQINKLPNNSLEGVTYSYLSTLFYGKASLKGLYQPKTKSIIIKEVKLVEMRSSNGGEGCLMTCYLDYKKEGNVETLTGTFTGVAIKDGKPCETGTVTLKKVPDSKFKKEDFLLKKEGKLSPAKPSIAKTTPPKPNTNSNTVVRALPKNNPNFADNPLPKDGLKTPAAKEIVKTKTPAPPIVPKKQMIVKTPVKPKEKQTTTPQKETVVTSKKSVEHPVATIEAKPKDIQNPTPNNNITQNLPKTVVAEKPKILEERKNKLANTLVVDAQDVTLEFYDNGEIDGDIITVYKGNDLVINKKMLSTQPLTLKLHFKEVGEQYNIYTIAETLGEIPPNTALMIVTYGGKRQEILLTSDSKTNALTVIEYNKASRKY